MTPLQFPEPESGVARVRFEIERIDYASPEASGRQGGVQAGWPLWLARYEIDRSDPVSGDIWNTFVDRLRGRQRLFFATNPARLFPRAYPGGFTGMLRGSGGNFDGNALAWSQNIDADGNAAFAMTGLPAGMVLSVGDLIGFKWDAAGAVAGSFGRRTMARVVTQAVASGAGAVTVMAEPPVDALVVPATAKAHLDRACCVMRIIPDKTDLGATGAGGALAGGTIIAAQDLRP